MPICKLCQSRFPLRSIIDGKRRNFQRRKYCLTCSPFGSGNRSTLERPKRSRSQQAVAWQKKSRAERKQRLVDMLGGGCSRCGYNRSLRALDFHHRDPSTKEFVVSARLLMSWDEVVREALKCELLCKNCHAEAHDS